MTYFAPTSFGARSGATTPSLKARAKAARGLRAPHASSCAHDATRRRRAPGVWSLERSAFEVHLQPVPRVGQLANLRIAPTSHPNPPAKRTDPHRPSSRDAIPIAHLLNSPPDDEFGPRFPVPGSLHSPEEDATTVPSPENDSEASHWSDEMEPYDPYVGAPDVGFDSFFDGLGTSRHEDFPQLLSYY